MPFSFRYPSQRRAWLATEATPASSSQPTPSTNSPQPAATKAAESVSRDVVRMTGRFQVGDFFAEVASRYGLFGMGPKAPVLPPQNDATCASLTAPNRRSTK
jgi:hypothetical protein